MRETGNINDEPTTSTLAPKKRHMQRYMINHPGQRQDGGSIGVQAFSQTPPAPHGACLVGTSESNGNPSGQRANTLSSHQPVGQVEEQRPIVKANLRLNRLLGPEFSHPPEKGECALFVSTNIMTRSKLTLVSKPNNHSSATSSNPYRVANSNLKLHSKCTPKNPETTTLLKAKRQLDILNKLPPEKQADVESTLNEISLLLVEKSKTKSRFYSKDIKTKIATLLKNHNIIPSELAELYNIPFSTINSCVTTFAQNPGFAISSASAKRRLRDHILAKGNHTLPRPQHGTEEGSPLSKRVRFEQAPHQITLGADGRAPHGPLELERGNNISDSLAGVSTPLTRTLNTYLISQIKDTYHEEHPEIDKRITKIEILLGKDDQTVSDNATHHARDVYKPPHSSDTKKEICDFITRYKVLGVPFYACLFWIEDDDLNDWLKYNQ
ncbi:hypothetical protein [Candidatus Fukatsuia endosymbiont of Tuberolachnus salignus]|uniref:hypothetical protein n=1 Tax=Candidatus Fukatsuia endosymbiont of Tuberolachnus salignus TaxID=3077957 RepID=UPI00313BCE57